VTDLDGPQELGLMAKFALGLAVAMVGAGLLWYGASTETLGRLWRNLVDRPSGPMSFRFLLQPTVVTVLGVFDGLKDERTGRHPFLWTTARDPRGRVADLRAALTATARVLLLGIAMDLVYQWIVSDSFYPSEAVVVAVLLAFIPYLLIRGPVAYLAGRWRRGMTGRVR